MIRLSAWLAGLSTGLAALHLLPIDGADPAAVAFSGMRVLALLLGWYLLVLTVLGGLARLAGAVRVTRALDVVTLPVVRQLLNRVAGLSMAASLLVVSPATAQERADTPPVMRVIDDGVPASPQPAPAPAPTPPTPTDEWVVEPGQNFWLIADRLLAATLSRPPSDAEIVPFWRALIAANAERLRVPGDPDLIFPGQRFVVPPVD